LFLAYNDNVAGLGPLGAGLDVELNALAFIKVLETIALDGGEVDENIRATFARDKAKALGSIEPLDGTCDTF
jgi:hypothetical protein